MSSPDATGYPGKRAFDVAVASLLLLVAAPLLALCVLLLKLSSPGPIFYRHRRCGKDGASFECLKLRTMVVGAERWLDEDDGLRAAHQENGYKLPTEEDPRVTSFGRLLRKTHLDELPQLWNVLRGDMSLVGPRPIIYEELEIYGSRGREFLQVRPGIFGSWTALGRSRPAYPERCEVELSYVRDMGWKTDLALLLRHLLVILTGSEPMKESAPERSRMETLYRGLSPFRRAIALAVYTGAALAAYTLAYLLRFELSWPDHLTQVFLLTLPVLLLIRIGSALTFRLTLGRWRYVGIPDVARLFLATTTGSVAFLAVVQLLPLSPAVPQAVVAIEWVLTTYLIAGLWISYRMAYEKLRSHGPTWSGESRRRALVVGAGEAGSHLVREMRRTPVAYLPVGILDDDPLKWGTTIHGIEVVGSTRDVVAIAEAVQAEELIIALPSADPAQLRGIVGRCAETGLPHKVLPGIAEVLGGNVSVSQLRDVEVEDLLGREPVVLALPELREEFQGTTVLVTGAAGSIGSELARQIGLNGAEKVILFDQAESDLYFVDLDLQRECEDTEIVPVVGDVLDEWRLLEVFQKHRPDFVFHAAAYKHVPLMESNAREAIRNNVLGTWKVASAAGASGAKKMVLVSTDKAVRPANVMGATKRVAELTMLACQERYPATWYTAVRFGNVLGSQGSVLPLFRRQLEEGEPLTVTHPEVSRYFMTVGEAVQLVLKTSLVPEARGHIAMLEMGEPVRILDLARNLLRLSGVRKNGKERIRFIGLRPGEKLHEDLRSPEERSVPTEVLKIRVLQCNGNGRPESILASLKRWDGALQNGDGSVDRVIEELWTACESGHRANGTNGKREPGVPTSGLVS